MDEKTDKLPRGVVDEATKDKILMGVGMNIGSLLTVLCVAPEDFTAELESLAKVALGEIVEGLEVLSVQTLLNCMQKDTLSRIHEKMNIDRFVKNDDTTKNNVVVLNEIIDIYDNQPDIRTVFKNVE